jgi:ABC-type phosphate transport system substrate-binding protein
MKPLSKLLLLALIMTPTLLAAETAIVNGGSSILALSEDEFKDYFTGKKSTWPDGSRVIVLTLKSGSSHDALLKHLGKNDSQFITGWKKLVFTGKGSMPEVRNTEADVVALVAKTPGALAYVNTDKVADGVKAIAVK